MIFVIWFFFSVVAGMIASKKGRSFFGFFVLSALLSPLIGIVAALVVKPNEVRQVQAGQARKCPYCAEMIRPDATVCRFCHKELPAYTPPPPVEKKESANNPKGVLIGSLILVGFIIIALVIDYFIRGYRSIIAPLFGY